VATILSTVTPPTVTDIQTREAMGADPSELVGKKIVQVVEVEDSDRCEATLVCDDGSSYLLSCDPGYGPNGLPSEDRWEFCMYDATETEAGRKLSGSRP